MSEIDLIPATYRTQLKLRGWAIRFGSVVTGLVVVTITAYITLHQLNKGIDREIGELQSRQEITAQQRDELKKLDVEKSVFANQLELLRELRSGAPMQDMFTTIDRAVKDSGVWFLNWEFRRANTMIKRKEESVNTGYFIIVKSGDDNQESETWKIETHMDIKGQAPDHAALSKFVRSLFEQPEIQDVRIRNTKSSPRKKLVEFDLAVIVRNQGAQG